MPFADRSFDLYTIALRVAQRHPDRAALGRGAARAANRAGGLCAWNSRPKVAPLLQPLYDLYSFHSLPLLGQVVTGDRDAYAYLVESIRRFPPQSELAAMIAAAGLERAAYRNLTGGIAALHSAWRL